MNQLYLQCIIQIDLPDNLFAQEFFIDSVNRLFISLSFTGVIAVTSILDNFDFSIHPSVTAGLIDPEHARQEMMISLGGGAFSSCR